MGLHLCLLKAIITRKQQEICQWVLITESLYLVKYLTISFSLPKMIKSRTWHLKKRMKLKSQENQSDLTTWLSTRSYLFRLNSSHHLLSWSLEICISSIMKTRKISVTLEFPILLKFVHQHQCLQTQQSKLYKPTSLMIPCEVVAQVLKFVNLKTD